MGAGSLGAKRRGRGSWRIVRPGSPRRMTSEQGLSGVERYLVCGVPIAAASPGQVLDELREAAWGRSATVHFCNTYTLSLVGSNSRLASALRRSTMNLPDGWPIALVGDALRVPGRAGQVPGPDVFMSALTDEGLQSKRHFLFGSRPEVLALLREQIEVHNPQVNIVGMLSPSFGGMEAVLTEETIARLMAARPDIVWVGLGTPLQDEVLGAAAAHVPATLVSVGAAFDFMANTIPQRADADPPLSARVVVAVLEGAATPVAPVPHRLSSLPLGTAHLAAEASSVRGRGLTPATEHTDGVRIAFVSRGLINPLAEIWPEVLVAAGHQVAHVDFEEVGERGEVAGILHAPPGPLGPAEGLAAEEQLGGAPEVVFTWWGTGAVAYADWARDRWRSARTVLCVDTFPNASVIATEIREVVRLRRSSPGIHGLVYFSEEMRDLHLQRAPGLRDRPNAVICQPLPQRMFARDVEALDPELRLEPVGRPQVIFTGRPDHLFSRGRRMAKDAVGPVLEAIESGGADVWVPSFRSHPDGWRHYPRFTNAQVLDGTFATFVAQFDAQLALYQSANSTVVRRLRCGLSSRFGLAFASPTTVVVPDVSGFARRMVETLDLGFALGDPRALASELDPARRQRVAASWAANRQLFEASTAATSLSRLFDEVVAS